jgi:glycine cleavage system H lipoate-binding protein
MLPGIYGFHWDLGHLIFLGVFYTVVVVIFTTLITSWLRARKDLKVKRVDAIRWHTEFAELPEAARHCRHDLTGEVAYRLCPNEFDCRKCAKHPEFEAMKKNLPAMKYSDDAMLGFAMPTDRLYHRGHTWVKPEPDNTYTIGLDDFGVRLLGHPDEIELPKIGSQLRVNGTAWNVRKQHSELRILAPIDGEVIETGGPEKGWYLRVKPANGVNTTHLLKSDEVQPWLLREMERLQIAIAPTGAALADGGLLVNDPASEQPDADWDAVWGEMFLES